MDNSSALVVSMVIGLVLVFSMLVPQAEARAFFVFGDSLVDNGNNNYLATDARADAPPYGIDYPTHRPTGRFSNGYNIPDLISQSIGEEATLPYLSPELQGQKLLVGANFASAGIGILNDTGIQFLNIIRITRQLENFQTYQRRLTALVGSTQAKRLVNQKLYDLGARRVLVTGTGPLGCVPAELAQRSTNGGCSAELQRAAGLFNPQLTQLINQINRQVGSDVFIAANTNQMHLNFITNPQQFGFVTSKIACCGQGPYNGIGLCTPASNLCPNRDLYAFWDPFHPSEKANKIIVRQIMTGSNELMHPMNLSTVLALDSKNNQ
ncbi:hypothetical protein AQUCO_10800006v1 [Aquilegia coerulea]|uniref:GDSL esterase/lipase n=1 Tax=Aquilegia coerulea TaxID=218851 RepID=A0A2G5C362_AQUCA|nr:hypothetical protein AQUCO_10800006v1 [Aquilegia coerulea]